MQRGGDFERGNDFDSLMQQLDQLLAELPELPELPHNEKKVVTDLTPVIIRVEDQNILRRLASEDELRPFQQEILKKLNLSVEEWNAIVEKLDLEPEHWEAGRVKVRIISDDESQFRHFNDRINGIYDGIEFLINSIDYFDEMYKQKLLQFLRGVTDDCSRHLKEIAEDPDPAVRLELSRYQNSIADYTKYVLDVLRSQLDMPIKRKGFKKVDELREMLARAEEFALAKKTKPAIVTISSIFKEPGADLSNQQEFMAMIDKPENPFADFADKNSFRNELKGDLIDFGVALEVTAKKRIETNPGYVLPEWYTNLSEAKQNQIIALYEDIEEENEALPENEKKSFDDPENLEKLMKKVMTIAFGSAVREELRAIQENAQKSYPQWFKSLKSYEKKLLKAFLKDIDLDTDLGSTINAISSKLRLIPIPSNYGTHTLITHIKKANDAGPPSTIVHPSEKRSSHAASRDVRTRGSDVRSDHAERNVYKMLDDLIDEKMKELNDNPKLMQWAAEKLLVNEPGKPIVIHIPILYQTLITPFLKEPDVSLDEDKKAAVAYMRKMMSGVQWFLEGTNNQIEIKFELISTNHPLNIGKYLGPTTSASTTGSEVAKLLSTVTGMRVYGIHGIGHKNFRKKGELSETIKNHNPLLQDDSPETQQKLELLTEACISLARITDDKRVSVQMGPYRELYLSSLEQIVTSLAGGGSIGSCVSGKDRKAIEIAHTDAMQTFFTRYGRLPPPNPPISLFEEIAEKLHANSAQRNFPTLRDSKDSNEFAKIFAEIYCTNHQQALAEQNAPGSFGTKTPGMYLPTHLKEAVKAWYRAHDKQNTPYEGLSTYNILGRQDRLASNNEINKIKPMFPMIQRLIKIFRKKPKPHLPPDDLQWKRSAMDNREIYSLSEQEFQVANRQALTGLATFEAEQIEESKKTGFFSHSSDAKKEVMRIQMFQSLLGAQSNLSDFQKNVLLYAIMKGENDTHLQHTILQAMHIPTLESARYILASNLKRVMNEYLDKEIAENRLPLAEKAQEFAKLETGVIGVVRDVLKYVDQKIEFNFDYKENKKEEHLDKRDQMVSRITQNVESILTAVSEENPHRIRTVAEAEEHQQRLSDIDRFI